MNRFEQAIYNCMKPTARLEGAGRFGGEHLYEDKTSLQIEEVSPEEAVTPARAKEIFAEQYARLEADRGDRFWVLEPAAR